MNLQSSASDEVRQHAVFRAVLQAMSRPGQFFPLPPGSEAEPLLTVLDALLDGEASFALACPDPMLAEAVGRFCGALEVPADQADFLLAPDGSSHDLLGKLRRGTPDYPDRGATVVYQVTSFVPGGVAPELTGPGIKDRVRPSVHGLDPREWEALRRVNSEFPLGIEAIFVSHAGEVLCIPRSTSIGS